MVRAPAVLTAMGCGLADSNCCWMIFDAADDVMGCGTRFGGGNGMEDRMLGDGAVGRIFGEGDCGSIERWCAGGGCRGAATAAVATKCRLRGCGGCGVCCARMR